MKKNTKNGIALALASAVALSTMSGCSNNKESNSSSINRVELESPASISEDVGLITDNQISSNLVISYDENQTNTKNGEDELVIKDTISPEEVVDKLEAIYNDSGEEFEDIISRFNFSELAEHGDEKDKLLLASALLKKIESYGIEKEQIIRELNNIMYLRLFPTDFDNETWLELFGGLCSTVDEYTNVTDYYYPLANVVHLMSCSNEHKVGDDGEISCELLQEELADFLSEMSYQNTIYESLVLYGDADLLSKFEKLMATGINMEEYLCELNTLFTLAINPTDCYDDETWNNLFGNLNKTLASGESLYDEYYELAKFIHLLDCTFEHQELEHGSLNCKGLEYIYK